MHALHMYTLDMYVRTYVRLLSKLLPPLWWTFLFTHTRTHLMYQDIL